MSSDLVENMCLDVSCYTDDLLTEVRYFREQLEALRDQVEDSLDQIPDV